jgi:hypothetical protein
MWDLPRLDDFGIFQKPWDVDDALNISRLNSYHEEQLRTVMEMSWKPRSQIYRAGGRGWWCAGDESRIIWKSGKAPHERPYRQAYRAPISVEDARDTLRMMKLPSSGTKISKR